MARDQKTDIAEGYVKLVEIAQRIRAGKKVKPITVRQLLRWFDAERRDDRIIAGISAALTLLDLRTEPWFEEQSLDGELVFSESYWGGSHRLPDLEKTDDFKLIESITDDDNAWLDRNLWLVQHHVEVWIKQHEPSKSPTLDQVQAKISALLNKGDTFDEFLGQFSEVEVLAATVHAMMGMIGEAEPVQFIEAEIPAGRFKFQIEPRHDKRALAAKAEGVAPPHAPARVEGNVFFPNAWPSRVLQRVPESPFRIRRLIAGPVKYLRPTDSVKAATTMMSMHDLSRLPVMTNERNVKGVISWQSIVDKIAQEPHIGMDGVVSEYMRKDVSEIDADTLLFEGIQKITESDYVLIRDNNDRRIIGIVTTKDLSIDLKLLAEPFLLIRQIENRIRALIADVLMSDDLRRVSSKDIEHSDKEIKDVFDLEFGDCTRLLQNKEFWKKLGLSEDQKLVLQRLEEIRKIRDSVVHFDPDGIDSERLNTLRGTASFVLKLRSMRRSATLA